MGREGLKLARRVSRRLPKFASWREARSQLFSERDARLSRLKALTAHSTEFRPNSMPDSLKKMEAWYFTLVDERGFRSIGTTREEVEDIMTTYFGHVVVATHSDAKWIVEESPFAPGHYGIGVQRGFCTWASSFRDHYRWPANKRRTSIFHDYEKCFGRY